MRPVSSLSGKFTCAVFVVERDLTLMLFHKRLQRWLPPGGKLEVGELPENAAHREVFEEVGLKIRLQNEVDRMLFDGVRLLTPPHHMQWEPSGAEGNIDFVYFARPIGGEFKMCEDEFERFMWMDSDLLDKYVPEQEVRANAKAAIGELSAEDH